MASPAKSPSDVDARGMPGKRLKRYRSLGEPPPLEDRLCLGDVAVPLTRQDTGDGIVSTVPVSGHGSDWLFRAMGFQSPPSGAAKIVKEIQAELQIERGKRVNTLWKGRVCTPAVCDHPISLS